jgi:hypothetical protein
MSVVHVVGEPTLENGTSAACGADRGSLATRSSLGGLLGRPPMYSAVTRRQV